jgi:hypothetical protein
MIIEALAKKDQQNKGKKIKVKSIDQEDNCVIFKILICFDQRRYGSTRKSPIPLHTTRKERK